jgi:hypothetical protein
VRIIIGNEELKDIGKLIGVHKGGKYQLTYLWEATRRSHFKYFFSGSGSLISCRDCSNSVQEVFSRRAPKYTFG